MKRLATILLLLSCLAAFGQFDGQGRLYNQGYPIIDSTGCLSAYQPHTTLYDTTTQTVAATAKEYPVVFCCNTHPAGCISVADSIVTVGKDGAYEFCISAIIDLSGGTNQTIDMWFVQNDTIIDQSNTINLIAGATKQTLAVCVIVDAMAGDEIKLMYRGSSTGVQIEYTPPQVSPTRPGTPSIIMTVKKIGRYP